MKDPIQFLLDSQKKFQESLGVIPDKDNEKETTQYIKNQSLYLIAEIDEMLRELPLLKEWKNYENFDREAHLELAKEEWIDMLHFIINIALALGLTEDDIMEGYCKKHALNYKRQEDNYGHDDR